MAVFSCGNCGFRFDAGDARKCPRCSSTDVREFKPVRKEREGMAVVREEKLPEGGASHRPPMHYREGKEGWKDFHDQQVNACPNCGGKEFDLDWKRKEKTCKKCGEILALPRRFA